MSEQTPPSELVPRHCHLVKWSDFDGYGFNLHAEKNRAGQYIGKVDEASPAEYAGLREGDRIIEVNGVNISNENHRQVVERIKAVPQETRLLVLDSDADAWFREHKVLPKSSLPYVHSLKTPVPRPSSKEDDIEKVPTTNGSVVEEKEVNNHSPVIFNSPPKRNSLDSSSLDGGSKNSTPKSIPKSDNMEDIVDSNGVSASPPGTPESGHSSTGGQVEAPPSRNGNVTPSLTSSTELNLNMSASQMRELLAARKKHDPKKVGMDLLQKYQIVQQM